MALERKYNGMWVHSGQSNLFDRVIAFSTQGLPPSVPDDTFQTQSASSLSDRALSQEALAQHQVPATSKGASPWRQGKHLVQFGFGLDLALLRKSNQRQVYVWWPWQAQKFLLKHLEQFQPRGVYVCKKVKETHHGEGGPNQF